MHAAAQKLTQPTEQSKVTSISSKARIDYIMRFSKQAVLVVGSESEDYCLAGSQFLGSLPNDHNAAFLSISSKLNDIQIRCRLIEQLFAEVLFDPEEPLAATVLKLASDKSQVISIVVENVHLLSLQLMHEFCQLAELAAKADRSINVLLLGEEQAGKLVAENKVVFNNKLSIISADSGQLIPLDSTLFSSTKSSRSTSAIKKALVWIGVLIGIIAVLVTRYQLNDSSLTSLGSIALSNQENPKFIVVNGDDFISTQQTESIPSQASIQDIYQLLTSEYQEKIEGVAPIIAQSSEVANILVSKNVISTAKLTSETVEKKEAVISELIVDKPIQATREIIDSDYFLTFTQGYVVQIIGFSKFSAYESFQRKNQNLDFASYNRRLNGQQFIVVTSKVYPLKSDALAALALLPKEIQAKGPWIKSVEVINDEIEHYQNNLYPITITL